LASIRQTDAYETDVKEFPGMARCYSRGKIKAKQAAEDSSKDFSQNVGLGL